MLPGGRRRGQHRQAAAALLLLLHGHAAHKKDRYRRFLDRIHAAVVSERARIREENDVNEKENLKSNARPWRGFIHVLCPWCSEEISLCMNTPITALTCKVCQNSIDLPRPTRAYINCECGCHGRYLTNRMDELFEIPCINCGSPNPVFYHHSKHTYLPISWLPKHRRNTKKK